MCIHTAKRTAMKEKLILQIPVPCREDWNKMTPAENGRHCALCNKEVIDFTLMTDQQIIAFFQKPASQVCGRLNEYQLQRRLQPVHAKGIKGWFALIMPFILLFQRSSAQSKKHLKNSRTHEAPARPPSVVMLGGIDQIKVNDEYVALTHEIHGRVIDEAGNAVAWASVQDSISKAGTIADEEGNFTLKTYQHTQPTTLTISAITYNNASYKISNDETHIIVLQRALNELKPVVVGAGFSECNIVAGGIFVTHKVTRLQKLSTTIRKITRSSDFKVYPNPAVRGDVLHIQFKNAGSYSIHLITAGGSIISAKETGNITDENKQEFTLPSSITQGTYFVRVIDKKTQKQFTEKIIVQ